MGAIYEVQHLRLGRRFALKTLTVDLSRDDEALARFKREADAISKLRHPNVVEIVDWETLDDGSPCMVMELLHGEDLAAHLRRSGPMEWPTLARIADQMMSALAAAHRAGITHRDIKPQNVFLATDDSGEIRVKLLDFGVSKFQESDTATGLTSNHQVIGTPAHMAPEQVEGVVGTIGPASDVWAMATILFEMATGQAAFRATTVPAVLYQICHGTPRAPSSLRADSPAAFDALIRRALSRDPEQRVTSVDRLRADFCEALRPLAPGAFVEPLRVETGPQQRILRHTPLPTTLTQASGQLGRAAKTPVAARRLVGRRTMLLASAVALFTFAFIVTWLVKDRGTAREVAATPPSPDARQTSVRSSSIADEPPPPSDAPARERTRVTVRVDTSPPGATIYEGTQALGKTPLSIVTELHAVRELVVKRSGYRDEVVRIDGTLASVRVAIEKISGRAPARRTAVTKPKVEVAAPAKPDPQTGPRIPAAEDIYEKKQP